MTLAEKLEEAGLSEIMLMDGLDEAFVGVVERCGQPPIAIYDYEACIKVLAKDGMSYDEAADYLYFNCIGAWMGPGTPGIMSSREEVLGE